MRCLIIFENGRKDVWILWMSGRRARRGVEALRADGRRDGRAGRRKGSIQRMRVLEIADLGMIAKWRIMKW